MKQKIKKIKEKISSIKLSLYQGANKENLGKFKSTFKGNGIQFKEHRPYVYGDDIRDINWSVLAKSGRPYVKVYEEERNVNLVIIFDVSPTMFYGLNGVSKLESCIELVCLLYLVAKETNDWVSVYFIGGKLEYLKKGRGEDGFFDFLIKLKGQNILMENGEVNISYSYNLKKNEKNKQLEVLENLKGNKNVIFFSDFYLWEEDLLFPSFFSSHWRLFRVVSPIDEGVEDSVSLFFKTNSIFEGKKLGYVDNQEDAKRFKYIKLLNIKDDYLNKFLREVS